MGAPQAWAYESSSSFETIDGAPSRAKKEGGQERDIDCHLFGKSWNYLNTYYIQ